MIVVACNKELKKKKKLRPRFDNESSFGVVVFSQFFTQFLSFLNKLSI